ncbi:MAG: AAA family ATPase [Phycisphaerae bacterium]|nr:AAA family ATPase [Phycisphaerae bacterium]
MRTIAIVNQKGGCGKTTTAINLAAVLARRGLRTLLVDMDPQSHCAAGLGVPETAIQRGVGEVLLGDLDRPLDPSTFLWEVSRNLHLAPSTVSLAALEAAAGGLSGLADRDRRLGRMLAWLAPRFDLCIVDCPPTIGLLTFNALRAADEAIVPVETGYFSLRGAEKQIATINRLVERLGRPLPFRLLATLYDDSRPVDRDVLEQIRKRYGDAVLPMVVGDHEVLREAASVGSAVTEFAPCSSAESEFDALAAWILDHPPVGAVPGDPAPELRTAVPGGVTHQGSIGQGGTATGGDAETRARIRFAPHTLSEFQQRQESDASPGHPLRSETASVVPVQSRGQPQAKAEVLGHLPSVGTASVPASVPANVPVQNRGEAFRRSVSSNELRPSANVTVQNQGHVEVLGQMPSTFPAISASVPVQNHGGPLGESPSSAGGTPTGPAALAQPTRAAELARRVRDLNGRPSPEELAMLTEPGRRGAAEFPTEVRREVRIALPRGLAFRVAVIGDFNGWKVEELALRPDSGIFELRRELKPGRYRYRLIVDGREALDPTNTLRETGPDGRDVSVLEVGP